MKAATDTVSDLQAIYGHLIMAQNIYDNADFFGQYNKLPQAVQGPEAAPEWPTLRRMVGSVQGKKVLDIGCSLGFFCRWAEEHGAQAIDGLDVSSHMIEHARTSPEGRVNSIINYQQVNLEQELNLQPAYYDVIYSSLTLHYLPNLDQLFYHVSKSLKPGGQFIFSVEHPVMTAPADPTFKRDADGRVLWPLNQYVDEGLRETHWLKRNGVRKYHYTVETYMSTLLKHGLILREFRETWDNMEKKTQPGKEEHGHRPFFLMVSAQRP